MIIFKIDGQQKWPWLTKWIFFSYQIRFENLYSSNTPLNVAILNALEANSFEETAVLDGFKWCVLLHYSFFYENRAYTLL